MSKNNIPFREIKCANCLTTYTPRVQLPKFCAKCHSPKWDNKIKMQNRAGHGVRVKHSDRGIKG